MGSLNLKLLLRASSQLSSLLVPRSFHRQNSVCLSVCLVSLPFPPCQLRPLVRDQRPPPGDCGYLGPIRRKALKVSMVFKCMHAGSIHAMLCSWRISWVGTFLVVLPVAWRAPVSCCPLCHSFHVCSLGVETAGGEERAMVSTAKMRTHGEFGVIQRRHMTKMCHLPGRVPSVECRVSSKAYDSSVRVLVIWNVLSTTLIVGGCLWR